MNYILSEVLGFVFCLAMGIYVYKFIRKTFDPEHTSRSSKPSLGYDSNDDLVTIAAFDLAMDAERAKSLIESENIGAFVMDANIIALNQALTWAAGGVRLQVALKHASHAQAVLRESGFKALVDIRNHHHCPECQSTDIKCHGLTKLQFALAVLFFGALFLFFKRDYSCNDCQNEWSS